MSTRVRFGHQKYPKLVEVSGPGCPCCYNYKKKKVRYQHYIGNTAAIKTLFGQNRKDTNRKIILQGEVFGPLERSVIIDTFGKECMKK